MEVPLEHTKEEETSVVNVLLVVAPLGALPARRRVGERHDVYAKRLCVHEPQRSSAFLDACPRASTASQPMS
jgi:hypothetical protein